MPLSFDELHPYQSLLLARTRSAKNSKVLTEQVLRDIEEVIDFSVPGRTVKNRLAAASIRRLRMAGLHYELERAVTWTSNRTIFDRTNHLVLVAQRGPLIGVHFSESRWKATVAARFGDPTLTALDRLEAIPSGDLNAAFVAGDAKTLWLSGTHRQARWKADNKVLSGLDLRDALDPLEDQTYHFTAARCRTDFGGGRIVTTGVTPRRSQMWIGVSREWSEFVRNLEHIFDLLEGIVKPVRAPLPFVAVPSPDIASVYKPYEIAILPAELDEDLETEAALGQERERWATRVAFNVYPTQPLEADSEVFLDDEAIGRMKFALSTGKGGSVRLDITGVAAASFDQDEFDRLRRFCATRGNVKIWFESGHTFANGEVFEMRFRDIEFPIEFADFRGFDVRKEKPAKGKKIGDDDSLFCWVVREWAAQRRAPGRTQWIGCDDGAHEKADFLCVDIGGGQRPKLTLIHAKGVHTRTKSGEVSPQRSISVADYEVVVGQAVKNVRWLDRIAMCNATDTDPKKKDEELAAKVKHAWKDGNLVDQGEFRRAVKNHLKPPYEMEVVVLQPQVTNYSVERAAKVGGLDLLRHRQLCTLLNQARSAAANMGAKFTVIGEQVSALQSVSGTP